MEETIACPNCGEINPADMPWCQNCQWRLRPEDEEGAAGGVPGQDASTRIPAEQAPGDQTVPDWLKGLAPPPESKLSADEAVAQQLRERLNPQDADSSFTNAPRDEGHEDLLAGLGRAQGQEDDAIPDWVARIMGISEGDDSPASRDVDRAEVAGRGDEPDALSTRWGFEEPFDQSPKQGAGTTDAPRDSGAHFDSPEFAPRPSPDSSENTEIYDWLRKLDADGAAPPVRQSGTDVPATTDVPTWVGRMLSVTGEEGGEPGEKEGSVPEWLSGSPAKQASPLSAPTYAEPEPFTSSQGFEAPPAEPEQEEPAPPASAEVPAPFTPETAIDDGDTFDVDAVFAAMQIPQWATPPEVADSGAAVRKPPAAQSDENIELAALPSWVQALRPVEPAAAPAEIEPADRPRESAGPLLGLQGVLPAVRGAALPSSAPKSHSIRLEVSERHAAHARLLEGLLDAETRPLPLPATSRLTSSRLARWAIASALFVAVAISLTSASTSFAFPVSAAPESNAALQALQAIPPDAAVLAVFDYEPATAGDRAPSRTATPCTLSYKIV